MSATNIKVQIQELLGATVPFVDHMGIDAAATADPQAAGHRTSTPSAIDNATPSSAGSAGSSNTARWRPGTTNSPAATGHRHHRRHLRLAMTTSQTRPSVRAVPRADVGLVLRLYVDYALVAVDCDLVTGVQSNAGGVMPSAASNRICWRGRGRSLLHTRTAVAVSGWRSRLTRTMSWLAVGWPPLSSAPTRSAAGRDHAVTLGGLDDSPDCAE